MAELGVKPSSLGKGLQLIMGAEDILPGDEPSYEICKAIWLFHIFGDKIACAPVRLAQSQDREITVANSPGIEEVLVERYREEWKKRHAVDTLLNVRTQARVYGMASVGMGEKGKEAGSQVDLKDLWKSDCYFNVWDPLNTPGMIIDQDPNSPSFQKFRTPLKVNGVMWHPSRTVTAMHESSVYLSWTSASYAYAGRSVFQRALYPLKSMVNTMVVDDIVAKKAALLVAKMEQPGSVVDGIMSAMAAVKRWFLRSGSNGQVLGISTNESVESVNMRNIDGSLRQAREDIIKNIATGCDVPGKWISQESFVDGFGEGVEDAKAIIQWLDRLRIEMLIEYTWMDILIQRLAWTPEWYETIQIRFPDYRRIDFDTAFYRWQNGFRATWPNLIKKSAVELAVVDEIALKSIIAYVQVHAPLLASSPRALVELLRMSQSVINERKNLFSGQQLAIDFDEVEADIEKQQEAQQQMNEASLERTEEAGPQRPFSAHDSLRMGDAASEWVKSYLSTAAQSGHPARTNVASFSNNEVTHLKPRI
jgi:hypothetical protein